MGAAAGGNTDTVVEPGQRQRPIRWLQVLLVATGRWPRAPPVANHLAPNTTRSQSNGAEPQVWPVTPSPPSPTQSDDSEHYRQPIRQHPTPLGTNRIAPNTPTA
eukprot:5809411-Pyramimonas_sp.AAC.1